MKSFFIFLVPLFVACTSKTNKVVFESENKSYNPEGKTIRTRFPSDAKVEKGSFAEYLLNLPLKPVGYKTHLYNGQVKSHDVSAAVIDMDILGGELYQCADAVIRLRAEYLYKTKQYDKIHFNFTNGFRCDYLKWRNGYRVAVDSTQTKTHWVYTGQEDTTYTGFHNYLIQVFRYAGTYSLAKELTPRRDFMEHVQIGDVLIEPGFPGHAMIVVNINRDNTRNKRVMVAQSYMPAQEIEILKVYDDNPSPWYYYMQGECAAGFSTIEWTFHQPNEPFITNLFVRTWEQN